MNKSISRLNNSYLKTLQAMTGATHRRTAARRALRIAGAGQTGFTGRRIEGPIETAGTEFTLIARRIVATILTNATLQKRIVAAAVRMTITLANLTISAGRPGTILEQWTALLALHAARIVLADALQHGAAWYILGAIRMAVTVQAGADTQLLEAVETALLQRL